MIHRRPLFTVVSLFIAIVFAVGSRPFVIHSIERQLAEASLDSAGAVEDSGRMAGLAMIAVQFMCGGIGAAIGVVLAAIGFWRRERLQALRWWSLILNLAAAGWVGYSLFPLLR